MDTVGDGQPAVEVVVDGDVAMAWRDAIPEDDRMADRIEVLLAIDSDLLLDDLDATQLRLVDLKADRIANQAKQAADAIDRGDEATAADVCDNIGDVARSLAVGVDKDSAPD